MKVSLGTIEVDDHTRRAIRAHSGQSGLATRAEIRAWYRQVVEATLEDVVSEYDTECAERGAKRGLRPAPIT